MSDAIVKCTAIIEREIYFKDNWGIVSASIDELNTKKNKKTILPKVDKYGCFIIKGSMPTLDKGESYIISAKEVDDDKYGKQYDIIFISPLIDIAITDKTSQRKFLSTIFSEGQVKSMYEALDNPFDELYNGNASALVKVKGCGFKTANLWLDRFNDRLPVLKIYQELEEYNLTNNTIKKLLNYYGNADIVIEKVKRNPYTLCEIDGIGWAKADEIAMSGGIEPLGVTRTQACILHYLSRKGSDGYSWVTSDDLMSAILDSLGEEITDLTIAESVNGLVERLWWNEDKTQIGLKKYRLLEENIGKEIHRIHASSSTLFNYDNWKETIRQKEVAQGWEYTDQQLHGIETVLNNKITVVHGLAGTGKSTIVDAILDILPNTVAQCALSGRAAARMAEITKREGFTIHRLLGYGRSPEGVSFDYDDVNPLPYDIIVVDEISMIDGYLFYYLLRAIKNDAKVILLGDTGQLEAIGNCNVANDIIYSNEVAIVHLTQIHRQAMASAIITESKKIRYSEQIIEKDFVGVSVRGDLQDLVVDCYSDKSNTFYKVMAYFSKLLPTVDSIMDLQVLTPVKTRGEASTWELNNAIQELYNPEDVNKKEIQISYNKNQVGFLREGDKVINRRNNRKTFSIDGKPTPIYNGNIGIISSIDTLNGTMIVNFQDIGEVVVDKSHMRFIYLGYAISIHSSQGSQFKKIIVAIDFSAYSLLTKQLLYTAITRAREYCVLVAQNSALRFATSQDGVSVKKTHLQSILKEIFHPTFKF